MIEMETLVRQDVIISRRLARGVDVAVVTARLRT